MNKHFFKSAYGKVSLMLIFLLMAILALRIGSAEMTAQEFLCALLRRQGSETDSLILYSVRLPRILACAVAGAGLSLSGVLLQSVTGNALASPNIIGVNAGAGFAVIITMSFLPTAIYIRPFAAFFGALFASAVIVYVSSKIHSSKHTVILAGIAVTTLLNAAISFISYFDSDLLSSYNYFSVGSLADVKADELVVPAVLISAGFAVVLLIADKADTLCLGDSIAMSLGVNVKAIRIICLVVASASAASVVSFAGLLGFVGLVVPHLSKSIAGGKMRDSAVVSVLVGAILVTVADLVGRTVFAPSEIPVGIVMAFVGAPFLFYLLVRRKKIC